MSERYSETEIRAQIHRVPFAKRIEMMSKVLETIDSQAIQLPHRDEMASILVVRGLTFKWRAWKISSERSVPFLTNGGLDQYRTHWWPHAPYMPEPCDTRLQRRYDAYLKKYKKDPVTRGVFSTAVIITCMQREKDQELLIS